MKHFILTILMLFPLNAFSCPENLKECTKKEIINLYNNGFLKKEFIKLKDACFVSNYTKNLESSLECLKTLELASQINIAFFDSSNNNPYFENLFFAYLRTERDFWKIRNEKIKLELDNKESKEGLISLKKKFSVQAGKSESINLVQAKEIESLRSYQKNLIDINSNFSYYSIVITLIIIILLFDWRKKYRKLNVLNNFEQDNKIDEVNELLKDNTELHPGLSLVKEKTAPKAQESEEEKKLGVDHEK